MTESSQAESNAAPTVDETSIFSTLRITQATAIGAAVASCVIFWYGAKAVGWPAERGYQGSLAQPLALGAFVWAFVLLAACTALGTLLLGRKWFLAGLMTATTGLATWSVRGGPAIYVLFNAHETGLGAATFLRLLVELIVLCGFVAVIWTFLWSRHAGIGTTPRADEEGRSTGAAILAQAGLMLLILWILIQTPVKKQVLTSMFIAGWGATAIAESYFANRGAGRWYWAGPLIAGAAGYLANYFSPGGIEIGNPTGLFAPLARVIPLDYASVGYAGVLLGYWMALPPREPPASVEPTPTSPAA